MQNDTTDAVLTVEDLTISLPQNSDRKYAIQGISFTVKQGETLCIIGESGSGKSMTANGVMRLLPSPDIAICSGKILYRGMDLSHLNTADMRTIRGNHISMIFQEPMKALNPLIKVGKHIADVIVAHRNMTKQQVHNHVLQLLDDVQLPHPQEIIDAYPFALSGGQRQRVVIAMALALSPKLLIADEPTTALDVTTQAGILSLIQEVQRKHNMGVIFITHDFGVVAEIADNVLVMKQGQMVEYNTLHNIVRNPQHVYTQQLITAVPSLKPAHRPSLNTPELLKVVHLSKTFVSKGSMFHKKRVVQAVKGVKITLNQGETLGIVGESGSGKSTMGRCIAHLLNSDDKVMIFGAKDVSVIKAKQHMMAFRRNVQVVFQDPYASLNPRHKIGNSIAEGLIIHGMKKSEALQHARNLLQMVQLSPDAMYRYPHEFSGGQRQRICIARALALKPKMIIADESVSALDVTVQKQILELFAKIQQEMHMAILFITHDLRVTAQVCDNVAVMYRGEIVEYNTTQSIFNAPQHPYTQKLLRAIPGQDVI